MNNSCLVGTFAIIYSINVVAGPIGTLVTVISGHMPFIGELTAGSTAGYIIFSLASTALGCYWAVCLYSLWKEVSDRPAATEPNLGGSVETLPMDTDDWRRSAETLP